LKLKIENLSASLAAGLVFKPSVRAVTSWCHLEVNGTTQTVSGLTNLFTVLFFFQQRKFIVGEQASDSLHRRQRNTK